jgi:hypothetical protein
MPFEIGKCYQHTTGRKMKIWCRVETYMWGHTLLAETDDGQLQPVTDKADGSVNWKEIPDFGDQSLYAPKAAR